MPILYDMMHTAKFSDANMRPKDWNEYLLIRKPKAMATLTALMALAPKGKKPSDPEFYWWTKDKPFPLSAIAAVYTDSGLSAVYNPAAAINLAAADSTLYVKLVTPNAVNQFPVNTVVLLYAPDKVSSFKGIRARVTEINSSTGYLKVSLLEADIAVTAAHVPGTFDHGYMELTSTLNAQVLGIGSAYAENAGIGIPYNTEPSKYYNLTQIFRTPLGHSRTFKQTTYRTGDVVKRAKEETNELHHENMERALLFGVKKEETDPVTGMPRRYTAGLLDFLPAESTKVFSGTWLGSGATDGWQWFNNTMMDMFLYGEDDRLCLCGGQALMKFNYLAESRGKGMEVKSETNQFGMNFTTFHLPTGNKVYFKTHPLFSLMPGYGSAALFLNPDDIIPREMQSTTYLPDRQANDIDGEKSEFLTEVGFEYHFPNNMRLLYV